MKINGIDGIETKKQAIHAALCELNDADLEAVKAAEPLLHLVGFDGLLNASKHVMRIRRQNDTDGFEIAEVLALMRAREHGEILYSDPVDVSLENQLTETNTGDNGVLIRQGEVLSVYLLKHRTCHVLRGRNFLREWKTNPQELAAHIARIELAIFDDGSSYGRMMNLAGKSLMDCADFNEFAAD